MDSCSPYRALDIREQHALLHATAHGARGSWLTRGEANAGFTRCFASACVQQTTSGRVRPRGFPEVHGLAHTTLAEKILAERCARISRAKCGASFFARPYNTRICGARSLLRTLRSRTLRP
eukprot:1187011-Prorocentrum_minimum.AAC.7